MIKIHQVKTRLVNSYVVEYSDKLLVMDVAINNHQYLVQFIEKELQRKVTDVTWVICSHDDPDHIGGVAKLAQICHAKVAIPYASHCSWRKAWHDPSGFFTRLITTLRELLRPRSWNMYLSPARNKAAKLKLGTDHPSHSQETQKTQAKQKPVTLIVDERLKHLHQLTDFEDWQIIHTPGHSWDSCCFYHAQSDSLLSGDTLLGSAKKKRLFAPAIYANRRDMIKTLNNLARLNITRVFPGHGSIIEGVGIIANAKLQ